MSSPLATALVVVPAHNEESVVGRGVRALLTAPGVAVRVVVVANGCSDATARRARAAGDERVEVVELSRAGKAGAVRAGLARAVEGDDVVAVVDADVVLSPEVLAGLVEAIAGDDEPRICAPSLALDLTGCSWVVRRYHQAWSGELHVRAGDIGARGIYAVNRAGLPRLRRMPDLIADDGWARAVFAPDERVVGTGTSTVRPARTWRATVRRRARVLAGNRELRRLLPPAERPQPRTAGTPVVPRSRVQRVRDDGLVTTAIWYGVDLPARALEAWRERRGLATPWDKDATSRA